MRRRLLAACAALVLLVAGTAVLLAYVRGADARALAGAAAVEVLVVDAAHPRGHRRPTTWPSWCAPRPCRPRPRSRAGSTDLAELTGRVATVDLQPGEQLLAGRFAAARRPAGARHGRGARGAAGGQRPAGAAAGRRRPAGRRRHRRRLPVARAGRHGRPTPSCTGVLVTQVQGAPARARPPKPRRRRPRRPAAARAGHEPDGHPRRRPRRTPRPSSSASSTAPSGSPWSPRAPRPAAPASSHPDNIYGRSSR